MRVLHIADPDCPETKTGYVTTPPAGLICAADHPARPVEWLWQDRIPLGKVTLLAGDPGVGKSLLALDLAARLSTGTPLPSLAPSATTDSPNPPQPSACGTQDSVPSTPPLSTACNLAPSNPVPHAPCSTLVLSSSDDYDDTIRPRLDAAGADPARVFYLPTVRDLRQDLALLRDAVETIPDCRLIIVDPINAYVGPSDAHFHTVVRRVLEPLAALAAEKSLAILAITHLNKSDGAAIQRAAGSMGFVAAARTIWTLVRDPDDPTRTLFLPLKNNLAQSACGLAFQITTQTGTTGCHQPVCAAPEAPHTHNASPPPHLTACGLATPISATPPCTPPTACRTQYSVPSTPPPPHTTDAHTPNFVIRHSEIRHLPTAPRLLWHTTPITLTPREAFRPQPLTPRRPTDREQAQSFLRAALADGPRPASELINAGAEHGFHRRTIQRAFHDLAGHTAKRGWTAGWWWSIGEYPLDVPPELEYVAPNAVPEVTYAHDVTFQNRLDQAHQEAIDRARNCNFETRDPEPTTTADNQSPSDIQSPSETPSPPPPPPRPNRSPSETVSPSPYRSPSRVSPLKPPTLKQSMAYIERRLREKLAEIERAPTQNAGPRAPGAHSEPAPNTKKPKPK